MKRLLSGTLLALLVLAGCGDDGDGSGDAPWLNEGDDSYHGEHDETSTGGPGIYAIAPPSGAIITLDLTDEPIVDDLVTRAENMREDAGYEATRWVPITVDNTNGNETIYIDYGPEIVTESGAMVQLNDPVMAMNDWVMAIGDSELTDDLDAAWRDRVEEQILPGAKYEGFLLADGPVDGVSRVFFNGVEGYIAD